MKVPLYIVYVYRANCFYPDRTTRRRSRLRAERAASRLQREGFATRLLAAPGGFPERDAVKS